MAAEFLYQDETVVAIRDINPQAPVHLLVLPRRHIPTLLDLEQEDEEGSVEKRDCREDDEGERKQP